MMIAGEPGIYKLSVVRGNCVSQDSILYCPRKNNSETNTFQLFPNPVSDKLWIACEPAEKLPDSIQVWNFFGGLIGELSVRGVVDNKGIVDVTELSAGVYVGILIGKNGHEVMRFTKL